MFFVLGFVTSAEQKEKLNAAACDLDKGDEVNKQEHDGDLPPSFLSLPSTPSPPLLVLVEASTSREWRAALVRVVDEATRANKLRRSEARPPVLVSFR